MKRIRVNDARAANVREFNEWMYRNRDKNHFDPEMFTYPSMHILAAEDNDGLVLFLPFHAVIMSDSLAPKPGASRLKISLALRECVYRLLEEAKRYGAGEIYFVAQDEETKQFAKSQGYEEMQGTVMRLKAKDVPTLEDRPQ
jgi:hypothetical protein